MNLIDTINVFVKIILNIFFVYLVYIRITNCKYKINKTILMLFISSIIAMVYTVALQYVFPLVIFLCIHIINGACISRAIENKFNGIAYIISFVLSYALYLVSVLISGIILRLYSQNIEINAPISIITIPLIETVLFIMTFKRRRFDKGFNFLKNKIINKNIINFSMFLGFIIIIFFSILQNHNNKMFNKILMGILVLITIVLLFWIKSQITKTYKSKMRDRTIEIQKTEIDEKNKILEEVKEENLNFATTIHKYNKKISALEYIIKNRLEQETNTEFANELAIILKETKETAENFAKETEIKTNKIPETNVLGIDTMLKYMQEEAKKKNINFDVKLNESINTLLESTISKDKFETLIGDHLKDAIIAVDASKNSYKSILVTVGLVEGIYEFSVYDTGIEFEIETLLKLGEEQITTHKDKIRQ